MAHRQQLDASVLDQGDKRDLKRFQGPDGEPGPAEHEMRLGMRRRSLVQRVGGIAMYAAIDFRQTNQRPRDPGTALYRLAGIAGKAPQQRRAAPQGSHERFGLPLGLGKSNAGRCPFNQAPCELILQREEFEPSAPVTGRQLQAGRDETLEGVDIARRQDFPHPRRRRLHRFRGLQRQFVHGSPPARQPRAGTEDSACDRDGIDRRSRRLRAGLAANIGRRVRRHDQGSDAFFGRLVSADLPEGDQAGWTGVDIG